MYKRLIDEVKQNWLREHDNLTNNRRLFNCDNRRIETHQSLITSLHSQLTNQINNQSIIPSTDVIQLTLTLKMTTAQVVKTSVTVTNNSPIQDYVHPDDQTQPTFEMTPGFKPFTIKIMLTCISHVLYTCISQKQWLQQLPKLGGFVFEKQLLQFSHSWLT